MKFHLYSDLHNEFSKMVLPGSQDGTLLLAGDILLGDVFRENRTGQDARKYISRFEDFLINECVLKYPFVYYIAGNHEFYHGSIGQVEGILKELSERLGIRYLDSEAVELPDDIVLFGSTLWTNFNDRNEKNLSAGRYGMNDFAGMIRNFETGGLYTTLQSCDRHDKTLEKLQEVCDTHKDKKILVMTHHAPTLNSVHPRYGGDPINAAYCSDLEAFIRSNPNIKVWCHGHTHDSYDYGVGECRVLCNPRGYHYKEGAYGQENPKFQIDQTFYL